MVRSGHHRKRSLSRSLSPTEHKRVKSSHRDREKERSRRRSRSRERPRRSRSRDRKTKDKRPSESRVRSKPLKLKRRSKSRSRSRSREHTGKKEEKKEIKADDEPFDPTNLDKQKSVEETAPDEDWIVTDMVQENSLEEDNIDENVQRNDVDENSRNNNQIRSEMLFNSEENSFNNNEGSEILEHRSNSRSGSESSDSHNSNDDYKIREKAKILIRSTNGMEKEGISPLCDDYDIKLIKNKIDLESTQSREYHQLRMKHELEKHNAEMKLIKLQIEYWQLKYSKSCSVPVTDSRSETCHVANEVTHSTEKVVGTNQENKQVYRVNHLPEEVSTTSRSIIPSQVTGTCHFIDSNEATKGGIEVKEQVIEEVVVEVNS